MAARFNGSKAGGFIYRYYLAVAGIDERHIIEVNHGNLNSIQIEKASKADATLVVERQNLVTLLNPVKLNDAVKSGAIKLKGDYKSVEKVLNLIELADNNFPLVPVPD